MYFVSFFKTTIKVMKVGGHRLFSEDLVCLKIGAIQIFMGFFVFCSICECNNCFSLSFGRRQLSFPVTYIYLYVFVLIYIYIYLAKTKNTNWYFFLLELCRQKSEKKCLAPISCPMGLKFISQKSYISGPDLSSHPPTCEWG